MIFATDLDNTMIFSHRLIGGAESEVHCVEFHQGRPITYMTNTAIEKLKLLQQRLSIIPATTRSITQFNRVEFWSTMPYAIVDNGGSILHYGKPIPQWKEYMQKVLVSYDLQSVFNLFCHLPNLVSGPKIVDDTFVFARSNEIETCKKILFKKLNTKIWQISFQGTKIYAIPKEITKGIALRYLCESILPCSLPVIATGDSNLDISMLEYATYGIIPCDCSLCSLSDRNWTKVGFSIYAADAILSIVSSLV